jgi:hypothetical protein
MREAEGGDETKGAGGRAVSRRCGSRTQQSTGSFFFLFLSPIYYERWGIGVGLVGGWTAWMRRTGREGQRMALICWVPRPPSVLPWRFVGPGRQVNDGSWLGGMGCQEVQPGLCPISLPPACVTLTIALFAWFISHQSSILFSQNKPATSNQPTVLFSRNKPATSNQPTVGTTRLQTSRTW